MINLFLTLSMGVLCLFPNLNLMKSDTLKEVNYSLNETYVKRLRNAVLKNDLKEITSVMVLRNDEIIIEEYYNGTNKETLHDTRSLTKSFTSTILGMAIEDGYINSINQTLADFYDLKLYDNYSIDKANVSLKSLLTMSSGFDGFDFIPSSPGNEENMYPTKDWVKFALDLPMKSFDENDLEWQYFTAGVIILGDILDKKLPNGLEDYARKRLFDPLGIETVKWQYTPSGVANTAGSCQLTTRDFGKYGQLYQNKGLWKGTMLLSPEWVKDSFTSYYSLPDNLGYGYLFWNKSYDYKNKEYEVFAASGNGGNKVFVFQDIDLVVVITATAYNQSYAHRQADTIVQEYILPALNLSSD